MRIKESKSTSHEKLGGGFSRPRDDLQRPTRQENSIYSHVDIWIVIQVFISYSEEHNRSDAELLQRVLMESKDVKIRPILAPRETSHAMENAEKIARLIDASHFFVTFYTKEGKKNFWVNQELGYAFNHVRKCGLKIIPVYTSREDITGFLTSKSHNFSEAFRLKEDNMKTFEEIRRYLAEEYKHPIKLRLQYAAEPQPDKVETVLYLTNTSPSIVRHGMIHIVLPKIEEDELDVIPVNVPIVTKLSRPDAQLAQFQEVRAEYTSEVIPEMYNHKFERVGNIGIIRKSFLLEDIYQLNTYETFWRFAIKKKKIEEFGFGVYVQIPLFGATFYEGTLFTFRQPNWTNRDAPAARIRIRANISQN